MIRKIIFTNYFSEFIHQVAIKFRLLRLGEKEKMKLTNFVKAIYILYRLSTYYISVHTLVYVVCICYTLWMSDYVGTLLRSLVIENRKSPFL